VSGDRDDGESYEVTISRTWDGGMGRTHSVAALGL
jgi:hypothetical protein